MTSHRATVATAANPIDRHPEQRAKHLARSPLISNVNKHLADINRPATRLNSALEVLQANRNLANSSNVMDAPCDLAPPTKKTSQITLPDLLTGVDIQDKDPQASVNNVSPQESNASATQPTPPSRSVRICKTVITANSPEGVMQGTATSPETIMRPSILTTPATTNATKEVKNVDEEDDHDPSTAGLPSKMHNRDRKLYRVFSEDGMKETPYHVMDFGGFYPVWPIVKFSMAPTGTSKDKRMTLFIKCVTALLGEMLYVDEMAMIAPIDITDDDEASFIKSKADLPSNFTKLGKHIMISGGSWVFNKKEKGSNDVYGRFRLKSQIATEDIINRVSFEFSRVGGKNCWKKRYQLSSKSFLTLTW
jgi:hypothetical protein